MSRVHLTDELEAAHPGKMKTVDNPNEQAAGDSNRYVTVLVLLTSADDDFPDGYKDCDGLIERIKSVSEIFGGRRGHWWKTLDSLIPMDPLYNSEQEPDSD